TKESKLSTDEKARSVKNIMALPKDQIVSALRKNGFNDIADITEAEMKKADEEAAKEEAREKRLAEIMAMPEEEQLSLLLAEGFEDEAKELSEKLANLNGETVEQGDGDPAADAAGTVADEGEDKTVDGDAEPKTEKKPKVAKSPMANSAKK
ncbi:MAG: hypothetical protein IKN69_01330, partial [Bacilli bacterium]|nr:hypothetical protein [Bacilli bacterium]